MESKEILSAAHNHPSVVHAVLAALLLLGVWKLVELLYGAIRAIISQKQKHELRLFRERLAYDCTVVGLYYRGHPDREDLQFVTTQKNLAAAKARIAQGHLKTAKAYLRLVESYRPYNLSRH